MKNFDTQTKMLFYFLKGTKRYFFLSIVFAGLVSIFDSINPKVIQYTIDSIIGHVPLNLPISVNISYLRSHFYIVALILLFFALMGALSRYLFTLFDAIGSQKLVQSMRNQLFSHIMYLPYAWHSDNHTGDIIQRCTSDVETIKTFVSEQLTSLFRVVLMIVLSLYFMIGIHLPLALIASAYIPVMIFSSVYFHRRIGSAFAKVDEEEGKLSSIAQENLTGIRVVRAFGQERFERDRFEKQNHGYTNLWVHLQKTLASFWVSGNVIATTRDLLVTVCGAIFCVQGTLTAGEYVAFISYNALLALPVRRLGRVIAEMSKAGISIDRLRYIMNASLEQNQGQETPDFHGDIVFDHVSYTYPNTKDAVLSDISFCVKAGQTVGILGATGSGKSTLMHLLDRLYEPQKGSITISGVDICDIDLAWLRQHIGMVLQEPFLFSKTLEENISISAHPSVNLHEVTDIADLTKTIEHFSDGYETFVGERGVTLSGGQKQRTAIAQMLMRNTPIVIFDDSFSAVDTQTDAQIQQALRRSMKDRTVLLIAHRITTLMHADWIVVMDHGQIVQQGTHQDLIEEEGLYKNVYELQTKEGQ